MLLEITMISAQDIKNTSSCPLFKPHLKPFITITITTFSSPSSSDNSINGGNNCHVYTTRVDDEGGPNPSWADKFHLPLDPTFFTNRSSCVNLQLYTKRAVLGRALLGWVQIPASDILDGLRPIGSAHHLSYRLLEKDGLRGHGVVNVDLRVVVGEFPVARDNKGCLAAVHTWRTAIGVPVNTCSMTWQKDQLDDTTFIVERREYYIIVHQEAKLDEH